MLERSAGNGQSAAGVLGKRKSSERDSHLSDDGYYTYGSCESTPGTHGGNSTSSTTSSTSCGRRKIKRENENSCRSNKNSSTVVPGNGRIDLREVECVMTQTRTETPGKLNADVNRVLDEFDSIFESPEAAAALEVEDKPSTATAMENTPLSPTVVVSDGHHTAVPPSSSAPHSGGMPHPPTNFPHPSAPHPAGMPNPPTNSPQPSAPHLGGILHPPANSHVSSSTSGAQMPAIESSVGLDELAKREYEEIKMAMEESLRQQVMIKCP